jgi:hypothetical protein
MNALFIEPDNQADLEEKLLWGMKNPKHVENMGRRAKDEMSKYIVDSTSGGQCYLRAFQKI